jgi:hypothetical protein
MVYNRVSLLSSPSLSALSTTAANTNSLLLVIFFTLNIETACKTGSYTCTYTYIRIHSIYTYTLHTYVHI